MKPGILYGIGVGPGDPELITVKGANLISHCRHIFVPKARTASDSVALAIAGRYISSDAHLHELVFPMTADANELSTRWNNSAAQVAETLETGADACFLTLGDPLLYSTYIYLLRALRERSPDIDVVTVPGITAFSAAAALTGFAVGIAKDPVTIVPTADDLTTVRQAIEKRGTIVLMKIGKRLSDILEILEETGLIEHSVFVSRAGMPDQRVEMNMRNLRNAEQDTGYLSIILVHANKEVSK
ncbi:MAG: precorrin-2 C(20)-methyltransferase [Armatimonadota bacterium]